MKRWKVAGGPGEGADLIMLVGADEAGRLLEIGVAAAEDTEFIVHAMPARQRFLR